MTGILLAVMCLAIAGAYWFLHQLLLNNGRVLSRLERIEKHLFSQGIPPDGGSGAIITEGLPVGSVLPHFELPALSGGTMKLSEWRGRKVLLIFFNPSCDACRDMLSHLAELPVPDNNRHPLPIVISTGDQQQNRRIFGRHGIAHPVLLLEQARFTSIYSVHATPAAYVVDEQGAICSALHIGTEALFAAAGHPVARSPGLRAHAIPRRRRKQTGELLTVRRARANNLKSINVDFPLGSLIAITGACGSGKSTLVCEVLYKALRKQLGDSRATPGKHDGLEGIDYVHRVANLDQSRIACGRRSNAATYLGFYDDICDLFAVVPLSLERGYKPAQFNLNLDGGRCPVCQGEGCVTTPHYFKPDVETTCGDCNGSRFNLETMEVRLRGKTIADVLKMSVEEGIAFFAAEPAVRNHLELLSNLALDGLALGQPAAAFSGSEAQRLKIAAELSKLQRAHPTVFILDEPTLGLNPTRFDRLLQALNRLVDGGHTVLVIDHEPDVIQAADYVIDLGREGGEAGGKVVAAGPPEVVAAHEGSYTALLLNQLQN